MPVGRLQAPHRKNQSQRKTKMSSLLRVENLTKSFPGIVAVDGVSLDIAEGEIHCLLGENGAGKTTLTECVYGTYLPESGKIFFRNKEVSFHSPRDAIELGIGMVHQHFVLIPRLSCLENIVVGTESKGIALNLKQAHTKTKSICADYGVELDLERHVADLSVGERQWVEILKTLYVDTEFLILDEPTAVLTPQEAEKLFSILQKMKSEGLSIILITHKLDEVMEISDRVTVMRKGKVIATKRTAEVTKPALARLMVGRDVVFRVEKESLLLGEPVLQLRDLSSQTETGGEVIRDISLEVRQREILGLAGVAGNGQKELFDLIVGVRYSSRGRIILDGEDITDLSPRKRMNRGIASIPQDRIEEGLLMDFSIAENLILGNQDQPQYRSGIFCNSSAIESFSQKRLSDFRIDAASIKQKARNLSGGNLQKLILARELSIHPKILIANQPSRGLDVGATEYVHRILLSLRKEGVGILLISSELEEIFNLSDRIAVIFKGRIMGVHETEAIDLREVGLYMAGISGDGRQ
jgi:simple sugar transport system ATP-binding protein